VHPPERSGVFDLSQKVALVTGASRGIGRAIAQELARCGANVGINYVQATAEAESIAEEVAALGRQVVVVQGDVSDAPAVDRMFAEVERNLGPVSVLVNAAGMETHGVVAGLSDEDWHRVLGTNLTGPFLCMKRSLTTMPSGGTIINISSIHSTVARKGAAHYCASKAGLEMLSKTAALELAPRGIRVNCIAPGAILTDMNRELIEHVTGPERWREWIPLGRVGSTEDVAVLTAFLASDLSSYITGEVITIDGAYSLNLVRYD
jgi:glucose 1-dehydrogenase/3-dehydrosphinganine reductase